MSLHPKLKSSLVFLAKLLVTIVPAFFVYRNIVSAPDWDISDLYRLFSVEGILPFTFALVCLAASNFTACLQWKLLLERQGVHLSYGHLLKLYYVGLFFNNFMPGNVGGDVKKVYDIRMQGGQDTVGAGLTATFFDRLYGLFFVTLFALAMGALFFVHDDTQRSFIWPSIWIFLGFCALFAGLCSRRIGRLCTNVMSRFLPQSIGERLVHMFERFTHFRSFKLWCQISLLSFATQALRIFVHFYCGIAVGVTLSISWYFYYILHRRFRPA